MFAEIIRENGKGSCGNEARFLENKKIAKLYNHRILCFLSIKQKSAEPLRPIYSEKAHNRYNPHVRHYTVFGLATPRCVASLFAPRMRKTAGFA